jgi:hypothetical protein
MVTDEALCKRVTPPIHASHVRSRPRLPAARIRQRDRRSVQRGELDDRFLLTGLGIAAPETDASASIDGLCERENLPLEDSGRSLDKPVAEIVPDTQPLQCQNANLSGRKPLRVLISTDFRER